MSEPVSIPDELPTAQKLAQHPRWEWRAGMGVRFDDVPARLRDFYSDGSAIIDYFIRGDRCWRVCRLADLPVDLADDATAGVVLGMVRAWAGGQDDGDVMAEWSQNDDDWRVDARRFDPDYIQHAGFGPTLGDAAGACLLACWARDGAT